MTTKLSVNNITPETINFLAGARITSVKIANDAYTELDDLNVDVNGGYIIIRGANFSTGCQVSINGTPATSISRISSAELRVQVPALPTGTYPIEVTNDDGSTAILFNGITYSPFPAWSTGSSLSTKASDTLINIPLSASEANSAPVTYSLPGSNTLPTGLTLYSNGYIQGRMTANSNATYNFAVSATDPQNQNALRDFSLPIIQGGGPVWLSSQPGVLQKAPIARFYANTITATDPLDTITYSVTSGSLPPGLTLDPITGTIAGTVSSFDAGNVYNFTATATDSVGYTGSKNIAISLGDTVSSLIIKTANSLYPLLSSNNHAFVDSSIDSANNQVTRFGGITQGTFSPFSLNGWSVYNEGNGVKTLGDVTGEGSVFSVATGTLTYLGFKNTIECWIYPDRDLTPGEIYGILVNQNDSGRAGQVGLFIQAVNAKEYKIGIYSTASNSSVFGTQKGKVGEWSHVCWQVDCITPSTANEVLLSINGVVDSVTRNYSTLSAGGQSTIDMYIGGNGYYHQFFSGFISNLRWVQSDNYVYGSSNFGPQYTLSDIPGTQFLLCKENRFVDSNTRSAKRTITKRSGAGHISPNSPSMPVSGYTNTTIGGSVFFNNGTGNYLYTSPTKKVLPVDSEDFAISIWFYPIATPNAQGGLLLGTGEYGLNSDWGVSIDSSLKPSFYVNVPYTLLSNTAVFLNTWNYVLITRKGIGSNNVKMFLNGEKTAESTFTGTTDRTGPDALTLGGDNDGNEGLYQGYVSGAHVIKGTGYDEADVAAIAIPTAPPVAVANTTYLLNFTNASIIDITGKNNLATTGGAVPYVGEGKYGNESIFFDGTGAVSVISTGTIPSSVRIGTQDFTIETWMKLTAHDDRTIFGYPNSNAGGVTLLADAAPERRVYMGNSTYQPIVVSGSFPTGTWCHVAVTRQGSNLRLLQDGIILRTAQDSTNLTGNIFQLGAGLFNNLSGYIDDPRITIGLARYTSNTTPPLELTYNT